MATVEHAPEEELVSGWGPAPLMAEAEALPDPHAREVADELAAAVVQLYGEGSSASSRRSTPTRRARLAEDGVVASLMLIHGLYPVPLETRVQEALDTVRPYLESHGGDVELLRIEDGVARLGSRFLQWLRRVGGPRSSWRSSARWRRRRPTCSDGRRGRRRAAAPAPAPDAQVGRARGVAGLEPRAMVAAAIRCCCSSSRAAPRASSWPTWPGRCWPTATAAPAVSAR